MVHHTHIPVYGYEEERKKEILQYSAVLFPSCAVQDHLLQLRLHR